jgi:hypothetical protein
LRTPANAPKRESFFFASPPCFGRSPSRERSSSVRCRALRSCLVLGRSCSCS